MTLRILIVDDEVLYLKCFSMGLNSTLPIDGFQPIIHEANNLTDALHRLNENNYQVVMTDGVFPEKSGQALPHHPTSQDFRGNQVAKVAKDKGVQLVIGISSEAANFNQVDISFDKPVDIIQLKETISQNFTDKPSK